MTPKILRLSKSGHRVAFQDQGSGEPLILLHGVGMQSAAWAPQIAALEGAYHVIAPDLPGHGGSDPLPDGSQLPDFVRWCEDVISTLNLGPVNLAGHSMGALIAVGYATQHPDMLRRVALLNGVYRRDATASAAVKSRAAEIRRGQIDLETPLARWFDDTAADRAARALVAGWLGAVDVKGYGTAYSAFAHGDATYATQLSSIACPFLALTGDKDQNSTPAMSQAMSDEVLKGHCVVIPGQRHMVNLTAAAQVNAHVLAWLKQPEFAKAGP